jgi:single-strand DNA-binding protein
MLNRVILIGRLCTDPTLKYTPQGTAVCTFTLAVGRKFKRDETDFIPIVVWQKAAENCAQYLTKGSQCAVEGRIQTRNYENQEGRKVYVTEVVAEDVRFLDSKGGSKPESNSGWDDIGKETNTDDIDW